MTYALILLFTVTNTGLPLIKHMCQMMQTSSLEACDMCKVEEETTCCEENDNEVSFTVYQFSDCCQSEILLKPISDKFLSQKSNHDLQVIFSYPAFDSDNFNDISKSQAESYSTDKSPPFLSDNHIYLINSNFLI